MLNPGNHFSVGQEALLHKPREIKPFFKISGNKIFSLKCDFVVTTYFTKSLKKERKKSQCHLLTYHHKSQQKSLLLQTFLMSTSEHYQRQCERNDFKVTGVSVFVYTVIFLKISTQKKKVWKKEKVNHGDLHKGTVCLNSRERTVSKTWTSHEDEMLYTFMIFNFFSPPCITLQSGKSAKIWKALLITFKTGPRDKLQWLGRE